ncbi:MAG: hypothetical protein QOH06_3363 [Acidobacteriota bacterium]|nr:hypothetical protein [Acidobacteriota bacterium]
MVETSQRFRLSLLFLALSFGTVATGRAATLAERAAQIDAPVRGGEVTLAGPLQIGRAEIVPEPGTRVHTLMAGGIGGVPCGLVLEGPAQLRYRVEDRFSIPVAERNVRRFSTLVTKRLDKGTEALEISTRLDGAVVWGRGLGEASQASQEKAAGLPDWAAKLLAGRRFPAPSHDLLAAEANGVEGARYALMRGELVDLLLRVDPRAGEENLYRVAKGVERGNTFREGLWDTALVSQPIGRAWWDRPPAELVAEHERLAVENPRGELVRIVSLSRLRARRAGISLWRADLLDRLVDVDGPHPITVRSVRVDGKDADFLHRDDELLVPLGRALADKEAVEVEVAYDGDLAQRPDGRTYWVLDTHPWYPRQGLEGELATLEISVDVPESSTPFASGPEVSRTEEGGRRKLVTRIDEPTQAAVVAAGKFSAIEEARDGVTCRAAASVITEEGSARKLLRRFFDARAFYEQLFQEPYPFRDISIVDVQSRFGQAPPGILFFAPGFYAAPMEWSQREFHHDIDPRFLHEIAHGWWGHVVKMSSSDETWLIEGFSEYSATLAVWYLLGKERGDYELGEKVKDWVKAASELRPGASLYLADRIALHDVRDRDDFSRLQYGKGPLVVHALRLELQRRKGSAAAGDLAFTELLRRLLKRNRHGHVTTPGLVAEIDKLTGGDWQPWFERYVYGTEIPKLPK